MGDSVGVTDVKKAISKREDHILNNLDTMTMKKARSLLESDLGLPADGLRPHKKLIQQLIDGMVVKYKEREAAGTLKQERPSKAGRKEEQPAKKPVKKQRERQSDKKPTKKEQREDETSQQPRKKARHEEPPAASEGSDDDNDNDEHPKRKQAGKAKKSVQVSDDEEEEESGSGGDGEEEDEEEERPRHISKGTERSSGRAEKGRRKGRTAKPATTGKTYGRKVQELLTVCRRATVNVGPSLYRGSPDDDELAARLSTLLGKYGLSRHSSQVDIEEVKQRLAREKELEGIDTSNIVEGGRRRAAAQRINYREVAAPVYAELSENEEPEEGSDEDGQEESSEDEELAYAEDEGSGKKPRRKADVKPSDSSGKSGGESDEELLQEGSDAEDAENRHRGNGSAEKKRAAARTPATKSAAGSVDAVKKPAMRELKEAVTQEVDVDSGSDEEPAEPSQKGGDAAGEGGLTKLVLEDDVEDRSETPARKVRRAVIDSDDDD